MSLWDRVKVNLTEWYTVAADKTEEVTRVGMRRYDRFGISRDIERQLTELGSIVYTAHREGRADVAESPTYAAIIRRVEELEAELQRKEEEIEAIRREARTARERKSTEHTRPGAGFEGAGPAGGAGAGATGTGETDSGAGQRAMEDPPGPDVRHDDPSAGEWPDAPRPDAPRPDAPRPDSPDTTHPRESAAPDPGDPTGPAWPTEDPRREEGR
ncbi:MAG: hypothetical protein R6X25_09715 [Candidatus Krumholzibacteriia bacterium]